jgi:hypothetical protein
MPRKVLLARIIRGLSASAILALIWSGCASPSASNPPGTPMKTTCPSTIELPSVEACSETAMTIHDELLRMCVLRQCKQIHVVCSDESRKDCEEAKQEAEATVLAITKFSATELQLSYNGRLFRFYSKKEIEWCEVPATAECVAQAVIHELAHSCGWDHREGLGVPGDDPPRKGIPECECVDGDGRAAPCR